MAAIFLVGVLPVVADTPVAPGTVLATFTTNSPLNDVQVFPDGEIVAVGNLEGLHVDRLGVSWISKPRGEREKLRIGFLLGVWGAAPDTVWTVTSRGDVLHWSAKKWSIVDEGSQVLLDIWGSSPTDIFAVGKAGLVVHFNGERWAAMKSGSDEILTRIWGSSAKNVYAVGEHGTVLHYEGSMWRRERIPSSDSLDMVSGSGPNDVFVAGWGGACLHFDGEDWKEIDLGARAVEDLVASGGGKAWAVTRDQGVLRFDGNSWSRSFPLPDRFFANRVTTAPNGTLVVSGYHGEVHDSGESDRSVTSQDGTLLVMSTGPLDKVPPN